MWYDIYFCLFALIAIICACGLAFARHPLSGALCLIGVMLSLAGIYSISAAPFLGIVQILVYTGAIMMLVIFVIMVVGGARDNSTPRSGRKRMLGGVAIGIAFFMIAGHIVFHAQYAAPQVANQAVSGAVDNIALQLFDTSEEGPGYFLLFEVIGVVLLGSMVGAVFLSKRDLNSVLEDATAPSQEEEGGH